MRNRPTTRVHIRKMSARKNAKITHDEIRYNLTSLLEGIRYLPMLSEIIEAKEPWIRVVYTALCKTFGKNQIIKASEIEKKAYAASIKAPDGFNEVILYHSVLTMLVKEIINHYNDPEFEICRKNDISEYTFSHKCIVNCAIQICETNMTVRCGEVIAVHDQYYKSDGNVILSKKDLQHIEALYRDIDSAYQAGIKIFVGWVEDGTFIKSHYQFLSAYLEVLIAKSQFIKKNKKAGVSEILRCYEELCLLGKHPMLNVPEIENINLMAKIALNVEDDFDKARDLAASMDAWLNIFRMNPDHDPEEFICRFHLNVLLKLGVHIKRFYAREVMHLSNLIEQVEIMLSVKDTIKNADEHIKLQFFHLAEVLVTIAVGVTCTFLANSELDTLRAFYAYIESLINLIDTYSSRWSKITPMMIGNKIESHRSTVEDSRRLVDEKIKKIIQEEEANQKRFTELEERIKKYDEEFERILKEFELDAKKSLPAQLKTAKKKLASQSKTQASVELTEVIEINAEEAPKSVSRRAREYFDSVSNIEEIESFSGMVAAEDKSEALLYIGDEYLVNMKIGSALTFYELALTELGFESSNKSELLLAIEISLESTNAILNKQIEYGKYYRDQTEANRRKFIINLGLRSWSQNHSKGEKLDLKKEETTVMLYDLGFEVFKAIGRQNNKMGLPLSTAAVKANDVKSRLAIFEGNQEQANRLLAKVEQAKTVPEFPSLTESSVTLFAKSVETEKQKFAENEVVAVSALK